MSLAIVLNAGQLNRSRVLLHDCTNKYNNKTPSIVVMLSVQEKSRLLGFLRDDAAAKDITSAITPSHPAVATVRCN